MKLSVVSNPSKKLVEKFWLSDYHDADSAANLLYTRGLMDLYDTVSEATSQVFEGCFLALDEAAVEAQEPQETWHGFFDMLEDDEPSERYTLPNGESAPYGLTAEEVSRLPKETQLFIVSASSPKGFVSGAKTTLLLYEADYLLSAISRNLVFAKKEEAVDAFNAMFGNLFGKV